MNKLFLDLPASKLLTTAIMTIAITMLSACGGGSGGGSGGVLGGDGNGSLLSPGPFSLRFGDAMDQDIRAIATDSEDNIIVVGINDGDIDLGAGTVSSADDDLFIAKFDSSGMHLWSQVIIGTGNDTAGDVAVDSNDDIFFTGNFDSEINFGATGDELTAVGAQDMFITKLAGASGAHIWSFSAGGDASTSTFGSDIAISPVDDSVVVAGVFYGTSIDLGGGALANPGGSQVFLAKYLNSNAAHQFSSAFGFSADQSVAGLAIDSLGNIALAGSFLGFIDLGGGTLSPNGGVLNSDAFLAVFDSSGNHLSSSAYGGTSSDVATGLAIDSSDIIVLTGLFDGIIDLGGGPLTTPLTSTINIYLARFNSSQTHLFSQRFGETGTPSGPKIAIDPTNDNMILAASHTGTIDFGGGLIDSGSGQDVMLASFSSNGVHIASAGYGDDSDQQIRDIVVSQIPRYLLAGRFDGVVDFGGGDITSMDDDAFLASLAP